MCVEAASGYSPNHRLLEHPLNVPKSSAASLASPYQPHEQVSFFFLRLPFDHHGPVSKLFLFTNSIQSCTGPFNWGEAHCAGEKVKLGIGPKKVEVSYQQNTNNSKQGAAHHGNQEPPGQPPRRTGHRKNTQQTNRDFN